MGMSKHVIAFINDEDPAYQKHANVLKACMAANVSLPKETAQYFNTNEVYEQLLEEKLEIDLPVQEWNNDHAEGFEILVENIPIGTYKIRFYNSW